MSEWMSRKIRDKLEKEKEDAERCERQMMEKHNQIKVLSSALCMCVCVSVCVFIIIVVIFICSNTIQVYKVIWPMAASPTCHPSRLQMGSSDLDSQLTRGFSDPQEHRAAEHSTAAELLLIFHPAGLNVQ